MQVEVTRVLEQYAARYAFAQRITKTIYPSEVIKNDGSAHISQ
jgi:hypothetical protein